MMYDYLRNLLEETFRVSGEIAPDKSFEDLDLDSLTTAEICAALEDDLKVTIDDAEVNQQITLGELADLLQHKGAVLSR
ncbi:acyl carrier protein [Streptomyces silvisoli]|uniref:Acyl carrier protein n=1 Tax=Streptomyces silvisoli TaxID=3034235 RepID=A0ABT5ZGW1_9ACTN|nr:acyl carrier protein [Streptomyces silvisoli]MDF3289064.1 acyl carrier protein [Streptomyces silvisoli]